MAFSIQADLAGDAREWRRFFIRIFRPLSCGGFLFNFAQAFQTGTLPLRTTAIGISCFGRKSLPSLILHEPSTSVRFEAASALCLLCLFAEPVHKDLLLLRAVRMAWILGLPV